MLKKSLLAASILSIVVATAVAGNASPLPADKSAQPTGAQLKQMANDARTPEQYAALAQSYSQIQKSYLAKATEEKQEWERRSQNIVSIAAKYPRPVDSARNLYDYYSYEAAKAGALASRFSQMATTTPAPAAR